MRRHAKPNVRRGQLQIAETLIAVALMLVLALLLINASEQQVTPTSNLSNLDQSALDIISASDEAGLLRPVIYLYGDSQYETEYAFYRDSLDTFYSSILSGQFEYVLTAHGVNNGVISIDYFTPIGSPANIAALRQGGESVIANYYLGSYSSAEFGQYQNQFLVQLYVWEKL